MNLRPTGRSLVLTICVLLLVSACSSADTSGTASSQSADTQPESMDAADSGVGDPTDEDPDSSSDQGEWFSRAGFDADPSDPEPLGSTGQDKTDLILATDPSAFDCVEYLGRGAEEILTSDKQRYEDVQNAYLFVAHFTDGTSIDIRVHPEVGDEETVRTEVQRYLTPLGQLPTLLRAEIGRFAVRLGDETATGSPYEGISMQVGNAELRESTGRLAETIFHESIHTSLDATYAYQRSQTWLDAQAADSRFLTSYGRENPDTEDLAESMLYAYVALHHPGRMPESMETAVNERIPNRIEFVAGVLPPGEPIFTSVGEPKTCS